MCSNVLHNASNLSMGARRGIPDSDVTMSYLLFVLVSALTCEMAKKTKLLKRMGAVRLSEDDELWIAAITSDPRIPYNRTDLVKLGVYLLRLYVDEHKELPSYKLGHLKEAFAAIPPATDPRAYGSARKQ